MSTDFPRIEDTWVWPDKVSRLIKKQAEGYTLHVCCGKSQIGDVRLDRDPENNPDVVGDMNNLPFPDCEFDTVVVDPPWKDIQEVGDKHTLFFEVLEKVKPTGIVLWNAYTLPTSEQVELEKVWTRQDYREGKSSLIARYRRWPNQQTL